MPPVISGLRTAIRNAFRSRGVPSPPALARVLETRPRGSRVASEEQLKQIGFRIESLEQELRDLENPDATGPRRKPQEIRKDLKKARKSAARVADSSGGPSSSASVAAEQGARAELGWSGTVEDLLSNQLGVDLSAAGGKRSDAFRRLDPNQPQPPEATPQEIAARKAIADAFPGENSLGSALEAIVTGRNRPELLSKRMSSANRVDDLEARRQRLPQTGGFLSRALRAVVESFDPNAALRNKPDAGARVNQLRQRIDEKLTGARASAFDAAQPLVSPQRIEEGLEANATNVRSIPQRTLLPLENQLGDTGMTPEAQQALDERKQVVDEEISRLNDGGPFSGSEDAEAVGIGPKRAPSTMVTPDRVRQIGEDVERLREVAGDTQEFADLEYLWNNTLGGGNRANARATSAKQIQGAIKEAEQFIADLDAAYPAAGSPPLSGFGEDTNNSLRLAEGASYEDAEQIDPGRLFFKSRADADIAAAAMRNEVPALFDEGAVDSYENLRFQSASGQGLLPSSSKIPEMSGGRALPLEQRREMLMEGRFAPDFREGRNASTEVFRKADGSVVFRIGVPVKETAGSAAPRTLFLEIPAMEPDRLIANKTGNTSLFRLDLGSGDVSHMVRNAEKVRRQAALNRIKGTMFDPDELDPTLFSGRITEADLTPAQEAPVRQGARRQLDAAAPAFVSDEALASRRADDPSAYDQIELEPGESPDDYGIAAPTEEARPRPRGTAEEVQHTYEGTPFATDEEFYDSAPANKLPENPPEVDAEGKPRGGSTEKGSQDPKGARVRRGRAARLGAISAAAALPVLSGAATKEQTAMNDLTSQDPAEYGPAPDINPGEPVRELSARERIANRLAELRGTTRSRRPLRYGTTQLYTPNWN